MAQRIKEVARADKESEGINMIPTNNNIYYDCSRCNCVAPCTETTDSYLWKLSNYCPDCGTKMEGGDKK